jgi:hypothetical protein
VDDVPDAGAGVVGAGSLGAETATWTAGGVVCLTWRARRRRLVVFIARLASLRPAASCFLTADPIAAAASSSGFGVVVDVTARPLLSTVVRADVARARGLLLSDPAAIATPTMSRRATETYAIRARARVCDADELGVRREVGAGRARFGRLVGVSLGRWAVPITAELAVGTGCLRAA